jgi:molecular chaperone GrpE (heat shock protein)
MYRLAGMKVPTKGGLEMDEEELTIAEDFLEGYKQAMEDQRGWFSQFFGWLGGNEVEDTQELETEGTQETPETVEMSGEPTADSDELTALRDQIEQLSSVVQQTQADLLQAQADADRERLQRLSMEFHAKAEAYDNFGVSTETLGDFLMWVSQQDQSENQEQYAFVTSLFDALENRLRTDLSMVEFGSRTLPPESSTQALISEVARIAKEEGVSRGVALNMVERQKPELYRAYVAERRSRTSVSD